MDNLSQVMHELGEAARASASALAGASHEKRVAVLRETAARIDASRADILQANEKDMANGRARGLTAALLDRLQLDTARLDSIIRGLSDIAALPDAVGRELARWQRPNGLDISRISTPLGVIAVIYESRPNVTIDAAALCVKSGNAAILRGGSESIESARALHQCFTAGLEAADLPATAVQMVPTTDRAAVGHLLTGLDGAIDVVVPRGGRSLVERVQAEARVPVIGHLEGICHVYVDRDADLAMAEDVLLNAKMRRPGICGAAETLLIDSEFADAALPRLAEALGEAGCTLRGPDSLRPFVPQIHPLPETGYATEYLAPEISVALVDGVDGALAHIAAYATGHTEAIITSNDTTASRFFAGVDSAIVLHNASTQFADGGEFGMGAEIGIATSKIHARGPVGVEQLTSFKYVVKGNGQTRP